MGHNWFKALDSSMNMWVCASCNAITIDDNGRPGSGYEVPVDSRRLTCEEVQAWRVHAS